MNRRLAISLLAAVVVIVLGAGVAVMVVRPWNGCRAPGRLCAALKQIKASDGVADAKLAYTTTQRDPKDGDSARASWTIELAADLSPDDAGRDAARAATLAERVGAIGARVDHVVELVAGRPTGDKVTVYPVMIIAGEDPAAAATQAYTLWRAGAVRVDGAGASAPDASTMLKLADLAVDNRYHTGLSLADGSVRYETYGAVVPADVRLVAAAGGLDDVEIAVMSGDRSLTVHTSSTDTSPRTATVLHWLKKQAPPAGTPTKYVLSSPGYAHLHEGWVGQQSPPTPTPHGPKLPAGVTPWPADPAAPLCTGKDLRITLTQPDAAAGSRYLAVLARNISGRSCALDGSPKLIFLNASGQPQQRVRIKPAGDGVVGRRIVVPAGKRAMATVKWAAMSTTNDPDVTTAVQVTAVAGATSARIAPREESGPTTLDILDGAEVAVGPWAQAVDGWSIP